jgi:hypothetical protein
MNIISKKDKGLLFVQNAHACKELRGGQIQVGFNGKENDDEKGLGNLEWLAKIFY